MYTMTIYAQIWFSVLVFLLLADVLLTMCMILDSPLGLHNCQ